MRYFLIMLIGLCCSTGSNAQGTTGMNISARIKGKKTVFTRAEASMEASFSPFYTIQFNFYSTPVNVTNTNPFGEYDYVNFQCRISRRQYLNKLPWPQTFTKFLYRSTSNESMFRSISYWEKPDEARDIKLVIEKVDISDPKNPYVVGTIEYKHTDDTQLKGAFRAKLTVK